MSLLPNTTNANTTTAYFLRANAQLINVSTLNAGSISAGTVAVSSLLADYVSTIDLYAGQGTISTFSTSQIVIDSQTLNATPTELLLNGVPIATQSSLSSIADWSLDPAISTVQMMGNDLNEAGLVSSLNVRAGNGLFNNLVAFNSLFVSSNTSTISSLINSADLGIFSTATIGSLSTTTTAGISSLTASEIIIPGGQAITLQNAGVSFVSPGSAQLAFNWDATGNLGTHFFYDTNLSSVRVMTKNPGGYVDNPASRVHMPQAGISSLEVSSISVSDLISTPQLNVSSINGSEFTSTGIVVQVAGVSSLVANSISSVGAEIRNALVSTIQFRPSFDFSLNIDTAPVAAAILGGLTRVGIGLGTGLGLIGTGLIAAVASRPTTTSVNSNVYYQYAQPTQFQFSTLGAPTSTFTRLVSSSGAGNAVPGQEIIISSIISSGTLCLRSLGDPINLTDPSTFTSTIQSFGEWIEVPPETLQVVSTFANASVSSLQVSSINGSVYPPVIPGNEDWALYPAISTINFSTGITAVVAASAGSDIALSGQSVKLIGGYTDAYNLLLVSSISTGTILGANDNLFGVGIQGLEIRTAPTGQVWISSPQTNVAGLINCSTVGATNISARNGGISSLGVSSLAASTISLAGLSTIVLSTSGTAGTAAQPAGRLVISGNDLDLGQQDLWAQQIRLGAGNPTNAQTEIIFYDAAAGQRGLQTALQDRTIRVVSTINANQGGYLLDTGINPPFFSTINNTSTALMAFFPSSINSTIGVSTLSFIPVSFQTTSAFSGTLLYPNISSSAVAANIVASTTIQTNAAGSYIIAQANTSFLNQTNQYHDIYLNIAIDGVISPSTFTSLPAGLNHYANGSIAYRAAVSSGTHTLVLYASADANAVAVGTQVDIWGTGNLAP